MTLSFDGVDMDLRRQELRRDGALVHVEPQVFDLLVHLIRNRDRVVTKDELFEVIWNGRIVSEAALSSCINAARKAVGDDGDRQALIKTIHRRGFRFVGAIADDGSPESSRQVSPPVPADTRKDGDAPAAQRKPSIAVMPFANLSREPDTEYFAYGLMEDIIRLLARHRWLDVLSRHSTTSFGDRDMDARAIGAALDVRYLVQGSVLRRGEGVRISIDLVSAETGRHLWSESYDLDLAEIFEIQETMAQQIAALIEPEVGRIEREAAMRKAPASVDAWDCYQRGLWNLWGFTRPSIAEAEAMFRRAIDLDPDFARAHGALAYVRLQSAMLSEPADRPALLGAALEGARTSVALDDRDCMNQCVLGRALVASGRRQEAIAALEQSVALNPSFAQGWFALADALVLDGRERDGIALLERATRLSPRDVHVWTFHAVRAMALLSLGEVEEAVEFSRRSVRHPRASYWPHGTLVACLGLLGRNEEAQAARAELLARMPTYSVARAWADLVDLVHTPQRVAQLYVDGLRRAGVPEGAAGATQPKRPAPPCGRGPRAARPPPSSPG